MNLFRSEEHLARWLHTFHAADDYVLPVRDWAEVFSSSIFRRRLDRDYLAHATRYLEDYRAALRAKGKNLPPADTILATVMFTDIVDSTRHAARLGDSGWRNLLQRHDAICRAQLSHFAGRVVKQTGDGFFAVFASPARAIRCAAAICSEVPSIGLQVRAGVHSGECEVVGDDLSGIAVHIGARVVALAGASEVLVSQTVKDAVVGSGLQFHDRGVHDLKGVPGEWRLYLASP